MRWIGTAIGALSLRTVCLPCRVRRWSWMYLHVDWLVQTVPWMWNSKVVIFDKQKCGKTLAEWDRIRHDKSVFAWTCCKRRDDIPHSMSLRSLRSGWQACLQRFMSTRLCQRYLLFIFSFWSDRSACRDWKHATCIEHLFLWWTHCNARPADTDTFTLILGIRFVGIPWDLESRKWILMPCRAVFQYGPLWRANPVFGEVVQLFLDRAVRWHVKHLALENLRSSFAP